ncbi:MAG TPA: hypothetical protein VF717_09690 [Pyrinomonadaceae bacterium]
MEQLYLAHKEFQKEWAAWRRVGLTGNEPIAVTSSRNRFWAAFQFLFETRLRPLRQSFSSGEPHAIDEVLDFLEIDIPAFRCGYEKEWYFRHLKSAKLDEKHRLRLSRLALLSCSSQNYRREFWDLAKLMIKLADVNFVEELQTLSESSSEFERKKSSRMLRVILENRKDLREYAKRDVSA